MKLVIQIPSFNEEQTIGQTIKDLPRTVPGFDEVEILVVDDGSTDNTAARAKLAGADHILKLETNRGLARAFAMGVEYALTLEADVVVNTDADNQYNGSDVAALVEPILDRRADIVVGCRPIVEHPEFSFTKKVLQLLGSWSLRVISKTTVRDATSGFRAFSREACQRLFIHSRFSYCMETLIQAGNSHMRVASVDVQVNPQTRPSRLFKSTGEYVIKSGSTILAMFILYRPGRFFGTLASMCLTSALLLGLRFLYLVYYLNPLTTTVKAYHIPSLILLSVLALSGVGLIALGIIAELVRASRTVSEELLYLQRQLLAQRSADSKNIPAFYE
jgi:glycosyltransferase involved in cell wall biosynthesis